MVIWVDPVPVTLELVTAIVSTVESSDDFLMVILPLSLSTALLKVKMILSFTPTPVAPSAGVDEDNVGTSVSTTVKVALSAEIACSQVESSTVAPIAT